MRIHHSVHQLVHQSPVKSGVLMKTYVTADPEIDIDKIPGEPVFMRV